MPSVWEKALADVRRWAESHGIRVEARRLGPETPGVFDGPSVTLNLAFPAEESYWYLTHAVGSIVAWALDPDRWRAVFEELDAAKGRKQADPGRLERALARYREFEEEASRHAVWLLADTGHAGLVPAYTNFARADLESMLRFHREGVAPPWRPFFAEWNREVAAGSREAHAYGPKPIPPFRPVRMRTQEVIQEADGRP